MASEKVLCEFRRPDEFEMRCIETDDGYRIELKGDKEKIRSAGALGMCCVPRGQVASCCPPSGQQAPGGCC